MCILMTFLTYTQRNKFFLTLKTKLQIYIFGERGRERSEKYPSKKQVPLAGPLRGRESKGGLELETQACALT